MERMDKTKHDVGKTAASNDEPEESVENVGDTNPATDNTEPQPIEMESMVKPKHDVGETGASNDESEERSENKEDDNVSKSATTDEDKERTEKREDDSISILASPNKEEERINVQLTTKIEQLEKENRELTKRLNETRQKLSEETEKNKHDLETVIADKIAAVIKAAEAEEAMTKQKSDIENNTRTTSNLSESFSTKQLKRDLKESKSREMDLQKKEKQLRETLTAFKTSYNKLAQTNDTCVKDLKEMKALKSRVEQKLYQKNADFHAIQKKLDGSEEHIRSLTLRLSKIAGANLAFQNPNIADLGDQNRPTRLAEKFSELYDNQWTDAFEQIDLQDDEDKIKRLYDILEKLDGHCLDVCWNYDSAVKESLTNLTAINTIKVLPPERTKEAENDTCSPSENGIKIPLEKDTTLPLKEESNEEMTENMSLCHTYLWHNKETEDLGGGWKMIKYNNDIDVKCISPESMTGSECTGHLTGERKREEIGEEGAEEEDGKEGKTKEHMGSGSLKQTGTIEAEQKRGGELAYENNEYNPDVKSDNESIEATPDVSKDTQELEDDTDCMKEANSAEKDCSHVELASQNAQSAEFKSDFNGKTEGNECNGDITQHDVEPEEEKQTKQDEHKENVKYLKFDFDTLTTSHKQTISEIRRIVHTQLGDQVVKAISHAVLEEMELPRETGVVSYVEECAKICWLARLHDPPVHIEFEEIEDDSPFKAEMYKPYTKTGKRLDYVVWPPVFLYKKGPMLSKGVAQGK